MRYSTVTCPDVLVRQAVCNLEGSCPMCVRVSLYDGSLASKPSRTSCTAPSETLHQANLPSSIAPPVT